MSFSVWSSPFRQFTFRFLKVDIKLRVKMEKKRDVKLNCLHGSRKNHLKTSVSSDFVDPGQVNLLRNRISESWANTGKNVD